MDKVEIVIKDSESEYNGRYVSVSYGGRRYGGASPCCNEEEVKRAIENAIEVITDEGDKPVVKDERAKAKLSNWLQLQ